MTAPSDGSAVKLAPVDIEAGKARTGLRPGAPVNARRIDHVNISVRDLDVSAAFYAALFGLEVKEEGISFGGRWCIIGSPDRFYLCLFEGHGADRFERYKAEGVHIVHFGLVVDDIDETVNRIRALGLPLEGTVDYPRSRSAYVIDPDGIVIEITNRFGGGLG